MTVSALNNAGFSHESAANETVEWYTPPSIFTALDMTFDLDPCSAGEGADYVPAKWRYTEATDGLKQPWFGTVFCNPPYGPATGQWMRKMAEHKQGIALVFARTDTQWFSDYGSTADLICFITKRVRFIDARTGKPGGSPGAGSMLLAWGHECTQALLAADLGTNVKVIR